MTKITLSREERILDLLGNLKIFSSILRAKDYENLIDCAGGFKSIKESAKIEVSAYVCPSTLL